MKNKLYYIFGLFMCFIFTSGVYADGISISLEGNVNNVNKGDNTEITVKLTADKVISSCQFKIESTDSLVFVTGSDDVPPNSWGKTGNITDGYTVTRPSGENPQPHTGGILKLGYTVNSNGKVTIKDVKCVVEEDSSEQTLEDKEISITAIEPADDTNLKSLVVKDGTDLDFKSDVYDNYFSSLSSSTFCLIYETSNPDYQDDVVVKDVAGNVITDVNNITFSDSTGQGGMPLSIIVNGTTTYSLLVSYVKKELDNSLASIKIGGSDLTLEPDKIDYTIDVSNDVNNVEIVVALKDTENFQIGKNSNIDSETLSGNFSVPSSIYIVVEPKDSSSGAIAKTYTISIKKKGENVVTPEPDEPKIETPSVNDDGDNEIVNPTTGDISMFLMILILISSLIVSVILYRKNLESYK